MLRLLEEESEAASWLMEARSRMERLNHVMRKSRDVIRGVRGVRRETSTYNTYNTYLTYKKDFLGVWLCI